MFLGVIEPTFCSKFKDFTIFLLLIYRSEMNLLDLYAGVKNIEMECLETKTKDRMRNKDPLPYIIFKLLKVDRSPIIRSDFFKTFGQLSGKQAWLSISYQSSIDFDKWGHFS